jgi:hypothetical protein
MDGEFVCPFCGAPYTDEMLEAIDGMCSFNTCDRLCVVVRCAACTRRVYVKGEDGASSWDTYKGGWRAQITTAEIAAALDAPREYTDNDDCFTFEWFSWFP